MDFSVHDAWGMWEAMCGLGVGYAVGENGKSVVDEAVESVEIQLVCTLDRLVSGEHGSGEEGSSEEEELKYQADWMRENPQYLITRLDVERAEMTN